MRDMDKELQPIVDWLNHKVESLSDVSEFDLFTSDDVSVDASFGAVFDNTGGLSSPANMMPAVVLEFSTVEFMKFASVAIPVAAAKELYRQLHAILTLIEGVD